MTQLEVGGLFRLILDVFINTSVLSGPQFLGSQNEMGLGELTCKAPFNSIRTFEESDLLTPISVLE